MTRKEYKKIAEVIKDSAESCAKNKFSRDICVNMIVARLIDVFTKDNKRFIPIEFSKVCGRE
jgi:hypothetical protein